MRVGTINSTSHFKVARNRSVADYIKLGGRSRGADTDVARRCDGEYFRVCVIQNTESVSSRCSCSRTERPLAICARTITRLHSCMESDVLRGSGGGRENVAEDVEFCIGGFCANAKIVRTHCIHVACG